MQEPWKTGSPPEEGLYLVTLVMSDSDVETWHETAWWEARGKRWSLPEGITGIVSCWTPIPPGYVSREDIEWAQVEDECLQCGEDV